MLSKNQSGFRFDDSCIYQLLAITHDIFLRFDSSPSLETCGVFLDIFTDRVQSVTLNRKTSDWEYIQAGVPQGSILEPAFFLIYINDLATDLKSNFKLFADDTSLSSVVSDPLETANILNKDLHKIRGWVEQWKMAFNPDPTKQAQEVVLSKKLQESSHPNLNVSKFVVDKLEIQKHLGLKVDKKLSFKQHLKR